MRRTILSLPLCVGLLALAACGGSPEVQVQQEKNTTTGKELQDLKAAYDKGIISRGEYADARRRILEGE